jgi:hypothetical protein
MRGCTAGREAARQQQQAASSRSGASGGYSRGFGCIAWPRRLSRLRVGQVDAQPFAICGRVQLGTLQLGPFQKLLDDGIAQI